MRNLDAIQQGLKIVRDALTVLIERVLTAQYGEDWWRRGVLDALEQDHKPIHDRPARGNAGDIDLQLALKLVQVYHWELFSDDLDWGGRQRSLLGAVTAVRNQYEGHVTPNREAELTDAKTQDILSGMEMFLALFDRPASDRVGNIAERLKIGQPDPELPDEGETLVLRRPHTPPKGVQKTPGRPIPPEHPRPVLRNGAAGTSVPPQAKPAWQRQEPVRWGAAVPAPSASSPEEKAGAPEEASPAVPPREKDTPGTSVRNRALGQEGQGEAPHFTRTETVELPAAARKLSPQPPLDKVKVLPRRPEKPPAAAAKKAGKKAAVPDPEPFLKRYRTAGGKSSPRQRPDPDLYIPAPVRERTPTRLRKDPYEVDIRYDVNRRGEDVLKADLPPKEVRPEAADTRQPLAPKSLLRAVGMTLLGVALGIGLILLDRWIGGLWG